jgi:ppGpp synthetase/RelA/SpoT-type nucleotidyltranferase
MDLQRLRTAYLAERARYEKLAAYVSAALSERTRAAGIPAQVTGRAKDVPNLLRKAIKKGYQDALTQITDKAGARVVVGHLHHVDAVTALAHTAFEVDEVDNKVAGYEPHHLGYLGVHLLVRPKGQLLGAAEQDLSGLTCEIQIHTKAQNAWSEVSHPLLYKPAGVGPESTVQRRLMRLLSLVEMFDEEVERARGDIMSDQQYRPAAMLQELEREYLLIAPDDYDAELSLTILPVVAQAYTSEELDRFDSLLSEFVQSKRQDVRLVLDAYGGDPHADPLLFQPEMLAIYERLHVAPHTLRTAWDAELDPSLLTTLSETLGRPV